jgi:1,4-dihydroxy-2-naphthoate octaprenyltransferase
LSYPFLRHWLAVSRTRIFVAVAIPALIGTAIAFEQGYFALEPFVLMLFGLVMVESANLFMADWAAYRSSTSRWKPPPAIEGSPMIPERLMSLRYSFHAAAVCFAIAALTFMYFIIHLGFLIMILGVLAVGIGVFYVLSPIKYGFFSTALLPPIIAFGSYYVLAGSVSWQPILASLPMVFMSSGVIFTYRVLYPDEGSKNFGMRSHLLVGIYLCAYTTMAVLVLAGVTAPSLILGVASLPILFFIVRTFKIKGLGYLPATSLGVLLYTTTGVIVALSYALIPLSIRLIL